VPILLTLFTIDPFNTSLPKKATILDFTQRLWFSL